MGRDARTDGATAAGLGAVLLWSSLALLTILAGDLPPLQLLALGFAIGGAAGLAAGGRRGVAAWRQPWRVWALGVGGVFGYHLLYVLAMRAAPAVEASLVAYLWPLLIVLLSGIGTGIRPRVHHVAGAGLGLAGAALVVTGGAGAAFAPEHAAGHATALAAAFVWAAYSVLSRRAASVPGAMVTGVCLVSALLACLGHLALEETVAPSRAAWLALAALGLGPLGLAFHLWDRGVKRGDLALLGAAGYAAPLLSTLALVAAGRAEAGWSLGAGCALIAGGAALAARGGGAAARPAVSDA